MHKFYLSLIAIALCCSLTQPVLAASQTVFPSIPKENFNGLTLLRDLPKQFILNEYYLVQGRVSKGSSQNVILQILDQKKQLIHNERFAVTNGQFQFLLNFAEIGSYYLSLSAGGSGSLLQNEIRVLSNKNTTIRNDQLINAPSNLSAKTSGNQTILSWTNKGQANLNILTFTQKNEIVRVYLSNAANYWPVDYRLFQNFTPGTISWTIQSAYSSDTSLLGRQTNWSRKISKNLNITNHHFADVSSKLQLEPFELTKRQGASLNLRGVSQEALNEKMLIASPDGKLEELNLKKSGPLGKESFSLNYTFKQSGLYLLEISNTDNLPLLNLPFYVGTALPWLPDFTDLPSTESDVRDQDYLASKLLSLVNQERANAKVTALSLDKNLNTWAQAYASEIASSGHFSHTNLAGQSTETRRVLAGILTPVGENLAQSNNLASAHAYLMRSLSHRRNLLSPNWNRVGFGFAWTARGQLVVVEEFSLRSLQRDPLTRSELVVLKREIVSKANAERSKLKLAALKIGSNLSNLAQNTLNHNDGNLSATLLELSKDKNFATIKNRTMTLTSSTYFLNLAELLSQHELLQSPNYKEVAIALFPAPSQEKIQILILLLR